MNLTLDHVKEFLTPMMYLDGMMPVFEYGVVYENRFSVYIHKGMPILLSYCIDSGRVRFIHFPQRVVIATYAYMTDRESEIVLNCLCVCNQRINYDQYIQLCQKFNIELDHENIPINLNLDDLNVARKPSL